MTADPVRQYVAERIIRDDWSFFDAINYGYDRQAVEVFRLATMLVQLCADQQARGMREHTTIHVLAGLPCPVGPTVLADTARSLGIPDQRARYLVDQLEQEWQATQGLIGSGGD
jgi:hypothetical protein